MKKLVQTGEDNKGVFNVMDGLSFVRAINENADELGTSTKLDLEIYNTPEAIAKALKEQSGKTGYHTPGGPDDLPTFEETGAPVYSPSEQKGGIAQVYNEAIEDGGDTTPAIINAKDSVIVTFKNKYNEDTVNEWFDKFMSGEFEEVKVKIFNNNSMTFSADGANEAYIIFSYNNEPYGYFPLAMKEGYKANGADVTEFTESGWYKMEFIKTESGEAVKFIKVTTLPELTLDNITAIEIDGEEAQEVDMSEYVSKIRIIPTVVKLGESVKVTLKDEYDEEAVSAHAKAMIDGNTISNGIGIQAGNVELNINMPDTGYITIKDKETNKDIYYISEDHKPLFDEIDTSAVTKSGYYVINSDTNTVEPYEGSTEVTLSNIRQIIANGNHDTSSVNLVDYVEEVKRPEPLTPNYIIEIEDPQDLSGGDLILDSNYQDIDLMNEIIEKLNTEGTILGFAQGNTVVSAGLVEKHKEYENAFCTKDSIGNTVFNYIETDSNDNKTRILFRGFKGIYGDTLNLKDHSID